MSALEKLSSFVMGGDSCSPSPEICEHLGNKAAQMAIDANISLTDAVEKVASGHSKLNNRHMSNIIWVANNEYFRKVAAARKQAGKHLVFEFELADPPTVSKQINASAQPKLAYVRDSDYDAPPAKPMNKTAGLNATMYGPANRPGHDALWERHIAVRGSTEGPTLSMQEVQDYENSKLSAMHQRHALEDLSALRDETVKVANMAVSQHATLQSQADETYERFYQMFKQAGLSHIPTADIVDLLAHHPAGDEVLEVVMSKVSSRLAGEEPLLCQTMAKTAEARVSGRADLSHPLYTAYDDMLLTHQKLGEMESILKQAKADVEYVVQAERQAWRSL